MLFMENTEKFKTRLPRLVLTLCTMPHCLVVLITQLLVLLLHCSLSNWFWGFSYLIGNGSFLLKVTKK